MYDRCLHIVGISSERIEIFQSIFEIIIEVSNKTFQDPYVYNVKHLYMCNSQLHDCVYYLRFRDMM